MGVRVIVTGLRVYEFAGLRVCGSKYAMVGRFAYNGSMEGLKEGGAFRTYAIINAMTTMGCQAVSQVVRPAVQAQPISGTCRSTDTSGHRRATRFDFYTLY